MDFKVEVDELNVVRISELEASEPLILQEKNPDGSDWKDAEEALTWGNEQAAFMQANKDAHAATLAELAAEATPVEEAPAA